MPQTLVFLNRLIILIILTTILLTSVDYKTLYIEIDSLGGENEHNLKSERRKLEITELALNIRSFINLGNYLER